MKKYSGHTQTLLTEGMGGRLKTRNGQLIPLENRINPHQMIKRQIKLAARRTVADHLLRQQARFMQTISTLLYNHISRGFFGRFKWLFLGR